MVLNILSIALAIMALVVIVIWFIFTFVILPSVKEDENRSKMCRTASVLLSLFALALSLCAFFIPKSKDTIEYNGMEYERVEQVEDYIPDELLYNGQLYRLKTGEKS